MTIEDLLTEATDRGWRLNNLFQLDSGLWQANLRSETQITDYGRGPTAAIALSVAMDNIETAVERDTPVLVTTHNTAQSDLETFRLADLLANLRSARPSVPIYTRRLL